MVTGVAIYIGSHTSHALLETGFKVVVRDNLCNSSMESFRRVEQICDKAPTFILGDICDRTFLDEVFALRQISAVLHFTGPKSVGESVLKPLDHCENIVAGSVLEMIRTFVAVSGYPALIKLSNARLEKMANTWRWRSANP